MGIGPEMGPMPEITPTQPEQQTTPRWESRIEKIRELSLANREQLVVLHGFNNPEKQAEIQARIEKIGRTMRVTINLTFESMLRVLREGRVKSEPEIHPEWYSNRGGFSLIDRVLNRILSPFVPNYRQKTEKEIGIAARGTPDDPRPIYGALSSENGKDEREGGGGVYYGDVFLILRNERVQNRSIFTHGDSLMSEEARKFPVVWEDAPYLKAMRDIEPLPYVEAQILGGVTTDDIEEVRIRVRPEEQEEIEQKIASIQPQFPDIKFTFVVVEEQQENV